MSNIYNQEPQAYGHIKFKTTFGDLDIELFTKQCPKATRNFIQLCLDNHYKNTIFDRVEKDFIAIGGSKAGDDDDDDDDEYFSDEFHSRLRFNRRGLIATANTKKNQNGSRFFFTLGPTPELQNKHTIFGRLKGNSIYSLVDLNECQVDEDFTPCSEQKITDISIIENPYPELVARTYKQSLNDNANADSSDSEVDNPLAGPTVPPSSKKLVYYDEDSDDDDSNSEPKLIENETKKFMSSKDEIKNSNIIEDKEDDKLNYNKEEKHDDLIDSNKKDLNLESSPKLLNDALAKEEKLRQIKAQIEALREQIESQTESKTLKQIKRGNNKPEYGDDNETSLQNSSNSEMPKIHLKKKERERETLEMVSNFKKKLKEASKEHVQFKKRDEKSLDELNYEDELAALDCLDDDEWLRHEFNPKDDDMRMAKDANMKDADWYTIEDPRHRSYHQSDGHHDRRHHADNRSKDRSYHSSGSSSSSKHRRSR